MGAPAAALAYASGWLSTLDCAANADADAAVEAELVSLARSEGRLRCALAELSARFAEGDGFSRLGFASMADWAAERVGRSGRSVYDHARVGAALRDLPHLRSSLASGQLSFAKVRLVARVAAPENERRWIAYARSCSAEALAREVRKIDGGSLEYGGLARDQRRARRLEYACTPEVVGLFGHACRAARQVSGQMLRLSECAEWIAAEVASALPIAGEAEAEREEACELPSTGEVADAKRGPLRPHALGDAADPERAHAAMHSHGEPADPEPAHVGTHSHGEVADPERAPMGMHAPQEEADPERAPLLLAEPRLPPWLDGAEPASEEPYWVPAPVPLELAALVENLEFADAFELERRLRVAFGFEQRLASRIGPLLERVLRRGVYLALGYRSREAYQRERLGLDPSECRSRLRVERAARISPALGAAWRAGELSFLQAAALVPLLNAELSEALVAAWIERARGFTLRRLRNDLEAALERREQDYPGWLRSGGLPLEPCDVAEASELPSWEIRANSSAADREPPPGPKTLNREISANHRAPDRDTQPAPGAPEWEICAKHSAADRDTRPPPEAPEREIGAEHSAADRDTRPSPEARERASGAKHSAADRDPYLEPKIGERELGAKPRGAPAELERCRVAMIVESEVAQLFRAVNCSVRRQLERQVGRPVTPGEALGWMCAHALRAWGALDEKLRREHRIHARDGWRCAVPGCSRMRNLHAHHVVYRSRGGRNLGDENLTTLCAFHHQRGVHGGTLRIRGHAPHALRFELGIRVGQPPLAVYASGDRKLEK